jgi:hypothetical protein
MDTNSVFLGESGSFFKKLIYFYWLAFICQLENAMKRAAPGEPKINPPFSAVSG